MPNQPGRGPARSRARARVRRASRRPGVEALETRRLLTTYVVTTTADLVDGEPASGSLREAIDLANADPGPDLIRFAITGGNTTGPQTIVLDDRLPEITDPVTIDGYSQFGSRPNTIAPLTGDDAMLSIEIDGTNAGNGVDGLTLNADGCVVRGLAINNFLGSAIVVLGNDSVVAGNFLGIGLDGQSRRATRIMACWSTAARTT